MCWDDDDTNVKSARYRPSPFVDARAAGELLQAAKKWGFVYLGISGVGIAPRDIEGGFWIQYERLGFSSLFSSFGIVVEIGGRLTLPQSRLFYACPQHEKAACALRADVANCIKFFCMPTWLRFFCRLVGWDGQDLSARR